MKSLNSSAIRSAFAILLGLILILWPEVAVTYLVISIGVCFIIPGIFSLLAYFTRKRMEGEPDPIFPIDGAGSILFGACLVLMPQFFVNFLMYILGFVLLIAGVSLLSCLLQFLIGRLVGVSYGEPISAAQALGQKNTVFAIWLAYTFLSPVTALAGGFYSVWHNVVNSWQLRRAMKAENSDE